MFYHEVNITIHKICDDLDIYEDEEVSAKIEDNLNLYIAFLYQKKYNKIYDERNWYLEEGARDFVREIENQWWNNTLDCYAISSDVDFKKFLQDEYSSYAVIDQSTLEDILSDFVFDIDTTLRNMTLDELQDLVGYVTVMIEYNENYLKDTIYVDDIIEELDLEEEDDD